MTILPFPDQKGCCGSKAPSWLTLPMAPRAAARSRFSGEEKLPQAVPPYGALNWLQELLAAGRKFAGVELDGPGDPLAAMAPTLDVLVLLRQHYQELPLALATMGFGLVDNVEMLAEHGVSRVTLLMDGASPEVIQNLYAWIRPGKRNIPLAEAAVELIQAQQQAITACRQRGIAVAIRSTVYAGVNEQEVEEIARLAAELGAESMTLVPGKSPEKEVAPPAETMARLSEKAGQYIHIVDMAPSPELAAIKHVPSGNILLPKPTAERPNVAVVSASGMDIDLHLGQAYQVLIYGPRSEDGLACLLEARPAPEPGSGSDRWQELAGILPDCFALLTVSAGENPRKILAQHGITVVICEESIDGAVDLLYGGGKKGKKGRK